MIGQDSSFSYLALVRSFLPKKEVDKHGSNPALIETIQMKTTGQNWQRRFPSIPEWLMMITLGLQSIATFTLLATNFEILPRAQTIHYTAAALVNQACKLYVVRVYVKFILTH